MLPPRNDIEYRSTKTYTHSVGLSAAFRQWRAESHCRYIHGYSLQVKVTFSSDTIDERNWVVDFGSLKSFKGWLEDTFDHKLLVAEDDPALSLFRDMDKNIKYGRLVQLRIVPATGCEAFARMIWEYLEGWLVDNGYSPRCKLEEVEVREHEANSAIVRRNNAPQSNTLRQAE